MALDFFEARELTSARERIQADTQSAASKLEMFLSDRIHALRMVSNILEISTLNQENFVKAAADFNLALPGLKAINWIAPEGTITWIFPESGNEAALGRNVLNHPQASQSFEAAQRSHIATLTPPLELFQGSWGVACYLPVMEGSPTKEGQILKGFLNGVFELDSIIRLALEPELLAHYHIELRDGQILIYPSSGVKVSQQEVLTATQLEQTPQGQTSIMVHTRQWQLSLRHSATSWFQSHKTLFTVARSVSLILAAAISLATYLALARRQAQNIAREERESMQKSLHQAQKLEAVGRLAGSVAHDFNNLMTTIVGNASLLEAAPGLGPTELQRLQQMQLACDRATGLTSQLLAFSTQGRADSERCQLQEEMDLILPLLRSLVPEDTQIELCNACPPTSIGWAPTQLAQVMTNLVSNACDAYEHGGIIEIMLEKASDDGFVRIRVKDQGSGMPPEVLDQACEPFFTTKPIGRGTGLGLPSIARIVEMAGGTMALESKVGVGTEVSILLPVIKDKLPGASVEPYVPTPIQPLNVLLVEDKVEVREAINLMLTEQGHQVQAFRTAEAALGSMKTGLRIDLLLTDLKLPGMSGLELVRKLRRNEYHFPVVLCSGYAEDLDADELKQLGAVFLPKPFAAKAMARAIQVALGPRSLRAKPKSEG